MLCYAINKHVERKDDTTTSVERKINIFRRQSAKCKFFAGDHVVYRDKLGLICHVVTNIEGAEWAGNKCKCVELFVYDDNDCIMVSPYDLKEH